MALNAREGNCELGQIGFLQEARLVGGGSSNRRHGECSALVES